MTNTEHLIANLEFAISCGIFSIHFYVGKWTGNNPSVVNALRRRGYVVKKVPAGCKFCYELSKV